MSPREQALAIFTEALAALDPARLAAKAAADLRGPVELWAVGKAAAAMARGVREAVPVSRALVVAKDGDGAEHAGHPFPDDRSLAVGRRLLERAAALGPGDIVVLALSGGASSLAAAPAWGLSLDDKIAATRAVAARGAAIAELNCVRKHISALKGGRLAAATRARIVALLLSDVVGDDPAVIGSGPATADPSTFADALAIARRAPGVPPRVLAVLEEGARGGLPETPKSLDARVTAAILAGPGDLLRAAAAAAGVPASGPLFTGTVEALADTLVAARATTVIAGEPTIALPAEPGRGGRAQHTALLVARALAHRSLAPPGAVLCAASDGSDGPTDDAGAVVTPETVAWARAHETEVEDALARRDAGTALAAAGALLTTGPTGRNHCDLYVVVP